ncbi:MAG: hypothetical protein JWM80_5408 [Cyanobacteria bacterium RYN_339]|nr:hypothetical protein [Cyanobacteria bacterium RYN_339]
MTADIGVAIRRLRFVYLVLIGLVFLSVAIGFGLDDLATSSFAASVQESGAWARRIDDLSAMLRSARSADEPGNAVFLSRDPAHERARLEAADGIFQLRLRSVTHDLDTDELPREDLWRDGLAKAAAAETSVAARCRRVLDLYPTDRDAAAQQMAHMDADEAAVEAALTKLIGEARADQQKHLAAQEINMASLRGWEPLLAAPLLLMALGALAYGHRLGEALRVLEAERLRANAILRQSHDLLEGRVHERTAELAVATQAAQAASQAKSRFLAAMGHELRTPLNAIIGYTEILQEDAVAENAGQQAADLAKVLASGHHLLAMVNDILDLSNLENGGMVLECTALEPGPLALELSEAIAPRAAANGNALAAEVVPGTPCVYADEARLRQCLLALLDNACKFTRNGRVHLAVGPAGAGWVAFRVADTGAGMSEAVAATVFESFQQGDGSSTRQHGGTGLGLAMVQRLVRLMGGHIEVESTPGLGSTFSILLPVSTAPASA